MGATFTPDELERYERHILLKEIGGAGQQRLKAAHIVILGMGGLGAPAALYLAAAGTGTLTLIDPDTVSLSNLQRQVLYRSGDVGSAKVSQAADALKALNPEIVVHPYTERLDLANAAQLLSGADLVLDGCDSFETRFAVNDFCNAAGKILISGAVGRWAGQVATFKSGLTRGKPIAERLPCYRCLVPDIPPDAEHCDEMGIVGALTGVIGSLMALEAIKEIAGAGESLAGRLLLYDGLKGESRTVALRADPDCATCGVGAGDARR
ncbi:MAG: ThiF family adenylyltransferase [Hyphomonadaceae bacterium]